MLGAGCSVLSTAAQHWAANTDCQAAAAATALLPSAVLSWGPKTCHLAHSCPVRRGKGDCAGRHRPGPGQHIAPAHSQEARGLVDCPLLQAQGKF